MKKKFFLAALTVALLASCSNDEVIETPDGTPITFRSAINTRATETTTANLRRFYVTALNEKGEVYFKDLQFNKNGDIFESKNTYYFPGDNSELTFYAYAPNTGSFEQGAKAEIGEDHILYLNGIRQKGTFTEQVDLVRATTKASNTTVTSSGENSHTGVPLKFSHAFAQLRFWIKSSSKSYKYYVKGIKTGYLDVIGNLNCSNNAWTALEGKDRYAEEFDEAKVLTAQGVQLLNRANSAMIIPQEVTEWVPNPTDNDGSKMVNGYISLLMKIETTDGAQVYPFITDPVEREYGWVAIPLPTDYDWIAGNRYTYTLNFADGAGFVDPDEEYLPSHPVLDGNVYFEGVEVEEWSDTSIEEGETE